MLGDGGRGSILTVQQYDRGNLLRTAACYKYLAHGTWYHTWFVWSPYTPKKAKCLFLHGAAQKILHSYCRKFKNEVTNRRGKNGPFLNLKNLA